MLKMTRRSLVLITVLLCVLKGCRCDCDDAATARVPGRRGCEAACAEIGAPMTWYSYDPDTAEEDCDCACLGGRDCDTP